MPGDLTLELDDIRYLGETGEFGAGQMKIHDRNNKARILLMMWPSKKCWWMKRRVIFFLKALAGNGEI